MRLLTLFALLAFALPLSAGWQRVRIQNPDGSWGGWGQWQYVGNPNEMPVVILPPSPDPAPKTVVYPAARPMPQYVLDPSCQTGA